MGKVAFVFPGQGAQAVGMGKDVYDTAESARRIYDQADEALGFALSDLIFQGPDSELKQTANTQPALLTTSIALYEAFQQAAGITPDYTAGHSLGEYSALVVSGVLNFEDAVRTVRARGEFMEQAVPGGLGAMAAVLGAERDALQQLCEKITAETALVELANMNCPGQIVVSGSREGVEALVAQGKSSGAKRVISLDVSGPFHSSLMKPAAEKLERTLQAITMTDATTPVVINVTAEAEHNAEAIRSNLVKQVYSPVLWEDSVQWLIEQGVDTFIEIGSGSVLTGLIRKIDKSVNVITINNKEAIDAFVASQAAN